MRNTFAVRKPRLRPCSSAVPYSFFFDLIRRVFPPRWGGNKPLHRLCSLTRKMGVRSLAIEDLVPNQEILDEQTALSTYTGFKVRTRATRLTFFRSAPCDWRDVPDDDFLGYAVLLRHSLPKRKVLMHVLESVIRPPTVFLSDPDGSSRVLSTANYYPHCTREYDTAVGTRDQHRVFKVRGTFFCQQNGYTHSCAHAALRMAINSSEALGVRRKLTNARIDTLLGVDHKTQRADGGLDSKQIQRVISKLGCGCHAADFSRNVQVGYAQFIYPFVESQLPVILGIEAQRIAHVVAVLGHTFNSDRWAPEARQGYGCLPMSRYISSASWADHFLINDDNYGMNITLPAEMIQNFIIPRYNPNLHASMAMGIVPSGTSVSGCLAEENAARLAHEVLSCTMPTEANRWFVHLRELARNAARAIEAGKSPFNTIVCRTLLVTKEAYVRHLASATDSDGNQIGEHQKQLLGRSLPSNFWLTEISLTDLFTANKHKLGDVISLIDPDRCSFQRGNIVRFLWLPGLAIQTANAWTGTRWPLTGHVPLMRLGNDGAPALEW